MNEKHNDKHVDSIVTRRTVVIFAVAVCTLMLITQIDTVTNAIGWLADVLAPVMTGVIFAYIINPVYTFCERTITRLLSKSKKIKKRTIERVSRGCGILLAVFFLIAIIALLLFLIIPEFLESFAKLIEKAPALIQTATDRLTDMLSGESVFIEHLGESLDTLAATLTGWIGNELSGLIGGLLEGAITFVSFLVDFLVSLVVCVYALFEKKKFVAQCKKILYAFFSRARANDVLTVARYGNEVFGKFISGKLITSSIVGITTFLFMTIMGMPYALLSAGIIAITNVIPFFGPFIGGIPTAFIVLITDARQGLIYIIFLVVLQQLEGNIIEPMIMEDRTGVSKFWVTVALLFCGSVFGLAGMIFSVPLFAILFYCIKLVVERKLAKKQLPISSAEYVNVGAIDADSGELYPVPEKPKRRTFKEVVAERRERKRLERELPDENNPDNNN